MAGRPIPKDGTLVRLKLKELDLAAGWFVPAELRWVIVSNAGGILSLPESNEAEAILSWAPMGYGQWSPYWDDLTEVLEAPVLELAKETWWIWQKKGHPPRFAWETEAKAIAEAQRLARRYPNTSFIVMHSVRKFRTEVPETQEAPDGQ
jgi:hypothetical protein